MSDFPRNWAYIEPDQGRNLSSVESAKLNCEKYLSVPVLVRLQKIVKYLKGGVEKFRHAFVGEFSPDDIMEFHVSCHFTFVERRKGGSFKYPHLELAIHAYPDMDERKEDAEVFQALVQIYAFAVEKNLELSVTQGEILVWDRERVEVEKRVLQVLQAFSNRTVNKDTESRVIAALMILELNGFKFLGLEKRLRIQTDVLVIPDNEEYVARFSRNETNDAYTQITIKASDDVEL